MTGLEMLLAKDQMREKIYLYSRCMDRCDNDLCDDIFTVDCYMDYGVNYQGDARGFCTDVEKTHRKLYEFTSHQYTDCTIKFKSDEEAVSETYAIVSLFGWPGVLGAKPGKRKVLAVFARYIDRWRKCEDGQWRICERHYCQEQTNLYDATYHVANFNSSRDKEDLVYKFFG